MSNAGSARALNTFEVNFWHVFIEHMNKTYKCNWCSFFIKNDFAAGLRQLIKHTQKTARAVGRDLFRMILENETIWYDFFK